MKESPAYHEQPCCTCGRQDLIWGRANIGGNLKFLTGHEKSWQNFKLGFGFSQQEEMQARLCNICGNVQLFLLKDGQGKKSGEA